MRRCAWVVVVLTHAVGMFTACALFARIGQARAEEATSSFSKLFELLWVEVAEHGPSRELAGLQAWVDRNAALPKVALLVVYGQDDAPLAVGSSDPAIRKSLNDLWQRLPPDPAGSMRVRLPGRESVVLSYLCAKLPIAKDRPGTAGLLAVRTPDRTAVPPWSRRAWTSFYCPLALLTLVSLLVCLMWLDRRALHPLSRLVRAAEDAVRGTQDPQVDASRCPTLDEMIRGLQELCAQSEHWKGEATSLRFAVDRRVDAKTRYIARQLRQAFKEAATDPLTGVGNRRVLDENLGTLIVQSLEADADLSLVLIDIDHFKSLNDQYGHKAGDEVLCFVGDLLTGTLRGDDMVVRIGGDEFVLLLPGVRSAEARAIAERLVAMFRRQFSAFALDPPLSLGAGIVSLRESPTRDPAEFLERADRALYAVKEHGKNGVCVYSQHLQYEGTVR